MVCGWFHNRWHIDIKEDRGMVEMFTTAADAAIGWIIAASLGGVVALLGVLVKTLRKIPRLLTEMRQVNAVQTAGILASHEAQEEYGAAIRHLAWALQKVGCNGDTEDAICHAKAGDGAIKKFKDTQAEAALMIKEA